MNRGINNRSNRWVFTLTYIIFAFFVVHVGNENSFIQLLQIPSYYTDLLLALCCSFSVGLYIDKLVQWMEVSILWAEQPKKRLTAQFFLGVFLPTVALLGIEAIYLHFLHIKLEDSSILYLELPLIFMLCFIVNLAHLVRHQNSLATGFEKLRAIPDKKEEYKQHFVVKVGKGFLNIPINEVAYFKIQNKLTFLITENGESYLYDFPFKDIINGFPPELFFQLNRQVIAKRSSIVKSSQTDTRRLQIELFPTVDEPVFVAKTKASDFKTWLQGI